MKTSQPTTEQKDWKKQMGRIKDHCQCRYCIDGVIHSSDCAVHNEPADESGKCDCEDIYISVFSEELSYYWSWWFGDGWTNDKNKYHLFLLIKKEIASVVFRWLVGKGGQNV